MQAELKTWSFKGRTDRQLLVFIALLSLAILILPHLLRMPNTYPATQIPYQMLRDSELLSKSQYYDSLNQERIEFDLVTNMVSGLSIIFEPKDIARYLPIILGIITSLFFYLMLREFRLTKKFSMIASVLLIVSPAFIYAHFVLGKYTVLMLFIVLAMYFLAAGKHVVAGIFLLMLSLTSPIALIVVSVAGAYSLRRRVTRKALLFIMAWSAFGAVSLGLFHLIRSSEMLGANSLVDFGALFGADVPMILLFSVGYFMTWKRASSVHKLGVAVLFVLALVNPVLMLIFSPMMSIYATHALILLFRHEYRIQILKRTTLLLVICTIIFSSLSYMDRLSTSDPSESLVRAIRSIPEDADIILTSEEYKEFILYFSGNKVLSFEKDLPEAIDSRTLRATAPLLEKWNVDHIFISNEMRQGGIWTRDKQGLLFLLENSDRFVNIYKYDNPPFIYEIWEYR